MRTEERGYKTPFHPAMASFLALQLPNTQYTIHNTQYTLEIFTVLVLHSTENHAILSSSPLRPHLRQHCAGPSRHWLRRPWVCWNTIFSVTPTCTPTCTDITAPRHRVGELAAGVQCDAFDRPGLYGSISDFLDDPGCNAVAPSECAKCRVF
jgi:hypothetical protein